MENASLAIFMFVFLGAAMTLRHMLSIAHHVKPHQRQQGLYRSPGNPFPFPLFLINPMVWVKPEDAAVYLTEEGIHHLRRAGFWISCTLAAMVCFAVFLSVFATNQTV